MKIHPSGRAGRRRRRSVPRTAPTCEVPHYPQYPNPINPMSSQLTVHKTGCTTVVTYRHNQNQPNLRWSSGLAQATVTGRVEPDQSPSIPATVQSATDHQRPQPTTARVGRRSGRTNRRTNHEPKNRTEIQRSVNQPPYQIVPPPRTPFASGRSDAQRLRRGAGCG